MTEPTLESDDARKVISNLISILEDVMTDPYILGDEDKDYVEFARQYLKEGWI